MSEERSLIKGWKKVGEKDDGGSDRRAECPRRPRTNPRGRPDEYAHLHRSPRLLPTVQTSPCCRGGFDQSPPPEPLKPLFFAFLFFFLVFPDKSALRKTKCWGQIQSFPLICVCFDLGWESKASKQTPARVSPPAWKHKTLHFCRPDQSVTNEQKLPLLHPPSSDRRARSAFAQTPSG